VEDTAIGKSVDSVPALRRAVSILDLVTNSNDAMSDFGLWASII
jgi:hypothetical protein